MKVLSRGDWDQTARRRAMEWSVRGEMSAQFGAPDPATLEFQEHTRPRLELIEQVGVLRSDSVTMWSCR